EREVDRVTEYRASIRRIGNMVLISRSLGTIHKKSDGRREARSLPARTADTAGRDALAFRASTWATLLAWCSSGIVGLIPRSSLSPPLWSKRRLVISSLVRNGGAQQRVAKKRPAAVARPHGPLLRSDTARRGPHPAYLPGEVTSAPACRNPGARQA